MNKTPKLRFKEFSGEWETKKLGDITVKTGIKNKNNENYDVYSISNKYGFIPQNEQFENSRLSGLDKSLYQIVGKGEFAYNPARINVGSIGVLEEDKKVIVSSLYVCFKLIEGMDYRLFKTYFDTYKFNKDVIRNTEGSVREYLFYENFSRIKINIPKLEEQEKIASFLSLIDNKISLQGEKVEALKDYKKGMMQKIFSRELRFKDDEGKDYPDWEEKKLEDICEFFSGGTPSTKNKSYYIGDIPFIRSAEISKTNTELKITQEAIKNSSAKMVDKGDLLYALYGATSGEVSISKIKGAINQAVLCIRSKHSNLKFLEQLLTYYKEIILSTYIQGGQGNLSGSIIKNLIYFIPSLNEQAKISNILSSIDKKIEKEQEKLDSLNQYKKGLLQQMFV